MSWTNWGFDGTINEAQWAQMAGLLGNSYVVAHSGDCAVTAVSGARSVSVAAGTLYGDGIVSVNSAPETVAMTTPVNGQWYVIALRRTWATNTVALVAIAGATTTTSVPSTPPTTFPTLNDQPGVVTDQPIAWAWCNSANETVVVSDLRELPLGQLNVDDRLDGAEADIAVLEGQVSTLNTNVSALQARKLSGLVPVIPTSAFKATSGTISLDTTTGLVSFSGTEAILVQGCFTSDYKNYRIQLTGGGADGAIMNLRYSNGTTVNSSANYYQAGTKNRSGIAPTDFGGAAQTRVSLYQGTPNWASASIDVFEPARSDKDTGLISHAVGFDATYISNFTIGCMLFGTTSFDGFYLYADSGLIGGTVKIYGYN